MEIKFHTKPRLKSLEVHRLSPATKDYPKEVEVQVASNIKVEKDNIVFFAVKQVTKHSLFEITIEMEARFTIETLPEVSVLEKDQKFTETLVDKLLPYLCEIIAYLTSKMNFAPLILPSTLAKEEDTTKSGN